MGTGCTAAYSLSESFGQRFIFSRTFLFQVSLIRKCSLTSCSAVGRLPQRESWDPRWDHGAQPILPVTTPSQMGQFIFLAADVCKRGHFPSKIDTHLREGEIHYLCRIPERIQ